MYTRRRHRYFAMMTVCIVLFVLAWGVVRFWSVPAAVGMCVVAMVIPPVAAITANRRGPGEGWWDEPDDSWLDDDPADDRWRRDEQAAIDRAARRGRPPGSGPRDPRDDPRGDGGPGGSPGDGSP